MQTIRVFPCPITVLPEEVGYVHRVVRTLHDALVRLPELYLADPAVRAILRLEPEEDAWLRECWSPAVRVRNPVFGRLDALVDYSSPVWKDTFKFIEPNLTGIGGLHLVPSVEEILSETIVPLLVARDPGSGSSGSPTPASCSGRARRPARGGRPTRRDRVCFVEPKYELEGIDEQRRLVEYLRDRHGMDTLHADPCELRMQDAEVYYEDVRVDLVYRDYSVLDLVELERRGRGRHAHADPVPREPGDELDRRGARPQEPAGRSCSDPEIAARHFDDEPRAAASSVTSSGPGCWRSGDTTLPAGNSGDLLGFARRGARDAGAQAVARVRGRGVVIGQTLSAEAWDQALDAALADQELWVVQTLAHIPVLEVPTLTEDGSLSPRCTTTSWATRQAPRASRSSPGHRSGRW